jgi:hypothetical protein
MEGEICKAIVVYLLFLIFTFYPSLDLLEPKVRVWFVWVKVVCILYLVNKKKKTKKLNCAYHGDR